MPGCPLGHRLGDLRNRASLLDLLLGAPVAQYALMRTLTTLSLLLLAACAGSNPGTMADAGVAAPRAVQVARATSIPACVLFVDAANNGAADGTAAHPHKTIAAAIASASSGAII